MRYLVPASLLCLSLLFVATAEAANVYIDPSIKNIGKGESVLMTVRLDTNPDECINALDGTIELDNGLQAVDISTGNSIFNLWVEPPTISDDKRTITFAGGITNGYCGRVEGDPRLTNSLLDIVVQAPSFTIGDTGVVPQRFVRFGNNTNAYLNDGFGTFAELTTGDAMITVRDSFSGDQNEWRDRVQADDIPPKSFSITLTTDDSAFQGEYFIVFNTTDKQTGIDHYEVIEEPLHNFDFFGWGAADAPWVRVTSPYVLTDQSLNSVIRVKAVDKAGNESITSMVPDESLRGFSPAQAAFYFFAGLATLIVLVLSAIAFVHYRRERVAVVEEGDEAWLEEGEENEEEDEYENT